MRNLLCILFAFVLVSSAFGQKAQIAFITDAEILWLQKEVNTLTASSEKMQTAVDKNDRLLVAANKTAIIKSVNRLSSNCNIMNDKIETEINPPTKKANRDLDTPEGYYYNKKKNVEALQELNLTANNIYQLKMNADQLKELKDKLTVDKFYFHPKYPEAEANLSRVYEMLSIAKSSNIIIQKSQVD